MATVRPNDPAASTQQEDAAPARSGAGQAGSLRPTFEPKQASVLGRIAASFMSMKYWVIAWVFVLAATAVTALTALPDPGAIVVTVTLFGLIGPINGAILVYLGGVSRIHGAVHVPFLVVMLVIGAVHMTTDGLGGPLTARSNEHAFVALSLSMLVFTACLVFDIGDLIHVLGGSTYVMGSTEAAEQGASRLSRVIVEHDLWAAQAGRPAGDAAPATPGESGRELASV